MTPSTAPPRLDDSQVRWVTAQAARAPSKHNTQPWRFRWDGHAFEVVADLRRSLEVSDPYHRELTMSCGAALVNLLLALRQLDREGAVVTFPDRRTPEVIARVTVLEGAAVSAAERRLFAAIARRHTHRGGFADHAISPALALELQQAAQSQGAHLQYVYEPGPINRILHLARAAERLGASDDMVREETKAWTPAPDEARRDGVPARAYSQGPPAAGPRDLPGRDFDVDRGIGTGERAHQPPGSIAVLSTEKDLAADWLQAGRALEMVLLVAAEEWAFATLHSRVTEVAHLRTELRRELGTTSYPQILLRFGYADNAPTTPRRPPEELLDFRD